MSGLFRKEVFEHKKNRLAGTISLVQPPAFKYLTWLILGVVIISLLFLSAGTYSRKEKVFGVIEPDAGLLRLGAPQEGIVSEVLVSEGDYVLKGEPILRIASAKHTKGSSELNQILFNQYALQLQNIKLQLSQELDYNILEINELNREKINFKFRIDELDRQAFTLDKRLELNNKIVKKIEALHRDGFVSELELQKQKDIYLSLQQQASNMKSERLVFFNQLEQLKAKLVELPYTQAQRTIKLNSELADIQIQLSSVGQSLLGELRAPKSGVISNLLTKVGKSVSSGESILSILPINSKMQAIIYVPTSAFGFVKVGQATRLRYHAFPYQRFGVYDGIIKQVSNSVIFPEETSIPGIIKEPSYKVIVGLGKQEVYAYGRKSVLRAGMMLDADIVIEERSLLMWLFDPIFSLKGQL